MVHILHVDAWIQTWIQAWIQAGCKIIAALWLEIWILVFVYEMRVFLQRRLVELLLYEILWRAN